MSHSRRLLSAMQEATGPGTKVPNCSLPDSLSFAHPIRAIISRLRPVPLGNCRNLPRRHCLSGTRNTNPLPLFTTNHKQATLHTVSIYKHLRESVKETILSAGHGVRHQYTHREPVGLSSWRPEDADSTILYDLDMAHRSALHTTDMVRILGIRILAKDWKCSSRCDCSDHVVASRAYTQVID